MNAWRCSARRTANFAPARKRTKSGPQRKCLSPGIGVMPVWSQQASQGAGVSARRFTWIPTTLLSTTPLKHQQTGTPAISALPSPSLDPIRNSWATVRGAPQPGHGREKQRLAPGVTGPRPPAQLLHRGISDATGYLPGDLLLVLGLSLLPVLVLLHTQRIGHACRRRNKIDTTAVGASAG